MPIESLGLRLRHARNARKVNQKELARAAGVKQPSISELETGETKEISGPTLIAVCKALKIRPEWLVTGEEPMDANPAQSLTADERELIESYRAASSRWRVSIKYMARLRGDAAQDEAAESMNVVLAKIAATPATDQRVEETYGFPPTVRPPTLQDRKAPYRKEKK